MMHQKILSLALPAVCLLITSVKGVEGAASSHCKATSNWPGWSKIKHAFIFGDSYTTTGFNISLTQPSIGNPLGNPTYPGWTASNGPNWVDYITVKYNESVVLTYNLADGGATVSSALVTPWKPTVASLAEQIESRFFPEYAGKDTVAWTNQDSIFAIFIGINDVGNSYGSGVAASTVLNAKIFAVYSGLVDMLYNAGGRNFVFLNVPPVDRSPLTIGQGTASQALEKADLTAFNAGIAKLASTFKKTYSDVNVFGIDTNEVFTEVLNKPSSHAATALYKNTTAYCTAYANGTPKIDTFDPTCGIPVNQYFWLNSLHPTYPMHDVLAETVTQQLISGPNVC